MLKKAMRTAIVSPKCFRFLFISGAASLLVVLPSNAQTDSEALKELKRLRAEEELLRERIDRLEQRLSATPTTSGKSTRDAALDEALMKARKSLPEGEGAQRVRSQADGGRSTEVGGIPRPRDFARVGIGSATARLVDISLAPVFTAGTSTADDEELETLEGGGHDPARRGFTLQQAELSLGGAVDPYFWAEAHLNFDESEGVETEEVFFTTSSLPWGLEVKGGRFYTEFGLQNTTHAHAWDWIDQPLVSTRIFGGDGARSQGVRLSKLLPLPWSAELLLGVQDASGENMASFRGGAIGHAHGGEEHTHKRSLLPRHAEGEDDHDEVEHSDGEHGDDDVHGGEGEHDEEGGEELFFEGIGRRPIVDFETDGLDDFLYLVRLDNFFDLTDEIGFKVGASGLFGPNSTGEGGKTVIFGGDMLVKWVPNQNFRGYPFVKWQSEIIGRRYEADPFLDAENDVSIPGETLDDWGLYSQLLYGFTYGWATGMRVEWAGGSGESLGGRENDPYRSDRLRLSPILIYRPTEYSRIRLQYNFDDVEFLDRETYHSVWLGFDMLIGSHPAHRYGQS